MFKTLEEIKEAIARISDLTTAELAELKAAVIGLFDKTDAEPTTPENVKVLNELNEAGTAIINREAEIEAAEKQLESDKENARKIRASLEGGEPEGDDGETEGDEEESDTDTTTEDKVPVVAGGKLRSSPSKMNGKVKPISPVHTEPKRAALVASTGNFGRSAGYEFTDKWDLAQFMADVLRGMDKSTTSDRRLIATANYKSLFPEERRLDENQTENARKIDAVRALVASGGTSLPANVDYSLQVWASPDRPIKSALDQYLADRGALTYRNPPTLASVASSTEVWTEATDANPSGATKPVYTVPVPSASTVYVNAIPTRLQFGNFMGQFDPETIAANTELAMALAARVAETELLTLIAAQCTADITVTSAIGASRDFLTSLDLITANFRYTHRIPTTVPLQMLVPEWFKSMIRADRVNELAHDGQSVDPMAIPDAWIENALALRGIEPIWSLDALGVNGSVYPTQQFSGFTASSAAPTWPAKVVWHLFIKGSMQFLDAGLLNLGVVRDATLDSTNDYETFTETFEGLAFRGFTGGALQIVSTLNVNGYSSAGQAY